MQKYWLIIRRDDNVIVNHHVGSDEPWDPGEGLYEVVTTDPNFDIGWKWDGTKAIDPRPAPAPRNSNPRGMHVLD